MGPGARETLGLSGPTIAQLYPISSFYKLNCYFRILLIVNFFFTKNLNEQVT